jgi:hypothetical protein
MPAAAIIGYFIFWLHHFPAIGFSGYFIFTLLYLAVFRVVAFSVIPSLVTHPI